MQKLYNISYIIYKLYEIFSDDAMSLSLPIVLGLWNNGGSVWDGLTLEYVEP